MNISVINECKCQKQTINKRHSFRKISLKMDNNKDILKKKTNRRTTYAQFEKLVDHMEAFPQLATGNPVFKCTKFEVDATWNTITQSLNSLGPPERTVLEWKKTWADLKSRTKQNIAENNKSFYGTGGGPSRIKTLTPLELQIDKICHLSSAAAPPGPVHGIKSIEAKCASTSDITPPRHSNKVAVVTPTHCNDKFPEPLSCSPLPTSSKILTTPPLTPSKGCSTPKPFTTSTPFASLIKLQKQKSFTRKRKHFQQGMPENEEELTLLRKQVAIQNDLLNQAEIQTKAFKDIAESLKIVAKTMSDLIDNLK